MRGAIVDSIARDDDGGCRVRWHYDGYLEIPECETMWWRPGPRDDEDAANLALAMLLPMVVSVGEGVTLPYAISEASLEFWRAKLGALQRFYQRPVQVQIEPVESRELPDHAGDGVALMFGGGVDSCSVLGHLLDEGEKPPLIRIAGGERPNGETMACIRRVAAYAGVPVTRVETNTGRTYADLCRAWAQHWNADDPIGYVKAFHRNTDMRAVAPVYMTHGFKFFFSALGALPEQATRLVYSWGLDAACDIYEKYGNGFSFYNELPYRGIRLDPRTGGNKTEEYAYLHARHPEIAANVKACAHDGKQWCGTCCKCVLAYVCQVAAGLPRIAIQEASLHKMHYATRVCGALEFFHRSGRQDAEAERFLFERLAAITSTAH